MNSCEKLLFIGIFCTANTDRTRMRTHFQNYLSSKYCHNVGYEFVIATKSMSYSSLHILYTEQQLHRDLYLLTNQTENMNSGKTFTFFTQIDRPFRWIAKMDMDTFPVLPNMVRVFKNLSNAIDSYWGAFCVIKNKKFAKHNIKFAAGAFYAITSDVIHSLHIYKDSLQRLGPEDQVTAAWLRKLHIGNRAIDCGWGNTCINIDTFKVFARPLAADTVFVHKVKHKHDWDRLEKNYSILFNSSPGINGNLVA